jgi:hypothetical protein
MCMEVDHFNPNKKDETIQQYANLFPATRHCNGAKRDRWPTNKDRKAGARFLNCCEEADYGVHIFEDPDNHELVGVTPEGRYHVRNCDLNAPHLVAERAERAKIRWLLEARPVFIAKGWSIPDQVVMLRAVLERMILPIPYLFGEALEKQRARKKALALLTLDTLFRADPSRRSAGYHSQPNA